MWCWHKWNLWVPYTYKYETWHGGEGGKVTARDFTLRQYRTCKKCGTAQDTVVAEGTGGPPAVPATALAKETKKKGHKP